MLFIPLIGNIGAGKSTFIKMAEALPSNGRYKVKGFYEPDRDANPYIEKFYEDPKKYGSLMQHWFQDQRLCIYLAALQWLRQNPDGIALLDRTIFDDIVFVMQNYKDGAFTDAQYQRYINVYRHILEVLPLPDRFLWLQVEYDVCHERVTSERGYDYEKGIPIEYMEGLQTCYEDIVKMLEAKHALNCLKVDWTNFGDVESVLEQLVQMRRAPELPQLELSAILNLKQEIDMAFKEAQVEVEQGYTEMAPKSKTDMELWQLVN